jgi:hypothetical protein
MLRRLAFALHACVVMVGGLSVILLAAAQTLAAGRPQESSPATLQPNTGSASEYKKSPSAKTKIKAPFGEFVLWVDAKKWKQQTVNDVPGALQFSNVNGEGYARVISERISASTDSLSEIALINAKRADPDARIVFKEKRLVNGRQVLALKIEATIKDIPFRFYSYCYGGTSGTIQVVAFTTTGAFDRNANEFTAFLNGLEISDQDLPPPPAAAQTLLSADNGLLLVNNGTMGIKYDPQKWRKTESKDPGRFTFRHIVGDGFALVIAERLEVPIDSLPAIALANAQKMDSNARITTKEKHDVNGVDVWFLKIEADARGIPFTYYGYYYGGNSGTVQMITYTGRNLASEYEKDFMEFLNGFRLMDK